MNKKQRRPPHRSISRRKQQHDALSTNNTAPLLTSGKGQKQNMMALRHNCCVSLSFFLWMTTVQAWVALPPPRATTTITSPFLEVSRYHCRSIHHRWLRGSKLYSSLKDMYRIIEQSDPEWFQTYVVNMLHDDETFSTSDHSMIRPVQKVALSPQALQAKQQEKWKRQAQEQELMRIWQLEESEQHQHNTITTTRNSSSTVTTIDMVSEGPPNTTTASTSSIAAHANTPVTTATATMAAVNSSTVTNATTTTMTTTKDVNSWNGTTNSAKQPQAYTRTITDDVTTTETASNAPRTETLVEESFVVTNVLETESSMTQSEQSVQAYDDVHDKAMITVLPSITSETLEAMPITKSSIADDDVTKQHEEEDVADNDDRVVLALLTDNNNNVNGNSWQILAPVSKFVNLGYDPVDDIAQLDANVLVLIADQALPRPQSGIPDRWKANNEKATVRIVSRNEALVIEKEKAFDTLLDKESADSSLDTESKNDVISPEKSLSKDERTSTNTAAKEQTTAADVSSNAALQEQESYMADSVPIIKASDRTVIVESVSEVNQDPKLSPVSFIDNNTGTDKNNVTKAELQQTIQPAPDKKQQTFFEPSRNISNQVERGKEPISNTTATKSKDQQRTENDENLVVLFGSTGSPRRIAYPLSKLFQLGYSQQDVTSLDPDALELIIRDGLVRPKSGIPSRWRTSDTNNMVQIVTKDEATTNRQPVSNDSVTGSAAEKEIAREEQLRQPNRRPSPRSTDAKTVGGERDMRLRQKSGRRGDPTARRGDPTARRTDDTSPRKIYNGRSNPTARQRDNNRSSQRSRDDPPPPTGFWPDIDNFRSMLRKEATLRLRLLGDDWAEVVKEESDWRLGLYKQWLWTLHNGVGPPIVESRMDRMRRMEQEAMKQKRQAAAESAKRRKRTRPNDNIDLDLS